jgi:hypothetical protein
MENITYLFGAGASKNSIPIVGELKNSMIEIKNKLLSDFDLNQENLMVDEEEYLIKDVFEDVIKDLGWVIRDPRFTKVWILLQKSYIYKAVRN